jgi:hypothetical protein
LEVAQFDEPGLSGILGQLYGWQRAQLAINQRQKLVGGRRIAAFDLAQDSRDVAHGRRPRIPDYATKRVPERSLKKPSCPPTTEPALADCVLD